MPFETVSTEGDFNEFIIKHQKKIIIIHFGASWAPQCKQINDILNEVSNQPTDCLFLYVEAEKVPTIAMKYKITAVPTLLFIKQMKIVKIIQGGHPKELYTAIKELSKTGLVPNSTQAESINDKLKALVNSSHVMLFMKGNAEEPKCGFSRKIVQLLKDCEADFKTFDVLSDSNVREELKKYSNWPTYPQLYINGELIGGLDICQELFQNGELKELVKETASDLESRLKELVQKERVMLFMKGSPDSPKCGFSRNTVEILNKSSIEFGHFDILSDDNVRQGLKTLFNWPTYPQLYVHGELIGGYDIIKELDQSGELGNTCKL